MYDDYVGFIREADNGLVSIAGTLNEAILKKSPLNVGLTDGEDNPRCLLAIEIEFSGSSKHILGDYTNASMMGHIGVVISSAENYEKISRVGEYVKTLRQLEKAPADLFCNTVHYREDEFEALLRRHIPQNQA